MTATQLIALSTGVFAVAIVGSCEKAFLQKLDKRLDDLYGLKAPHPDRTRTLGMEPPPK
jgi:hypothetical protein